MYILMFFSRCDMLFALELDVNNLIHVGTHLASFKHGLSPTLVEYTQKE